MKNLLLVLFTLLLTSAFAQVPNTADSIYWAVVTLTTVGYGDVVPVSALGKTISVLIMLVLESSFDYFS